MELPACEICFFELCLHYGAKLAKYARSKRFMIIHEGGGGGSKCDVIKRGGEDYCDGSVTEGGEGVQNSLNLCDVIYERPQMHITPFIFAFVIMLFLNTVHTGLYTQKHKMGVMRP